MIRRTFVSICAVLLVVASSSETQSGKEAEHRSIAKELDVWVTKTQEHLVPAADAMPEEKYGFAPSGGEFKDVRTFGEQVKHLAAANYMLASAALGEKPPHGERNETAPDSVKSKAEIMEYLKGSFAHLHRAATAISEKNENDVVRLDRTRPGLIVDALCHAWDHYGQIVEYLRMNGIVPPASR